MRTLIGSLLLAGYLFLTSPQMALGDTINFEWDKVTKTVSGDPLVSLSGYKLYVSQISNSYGTPTAGFIAPKPVAVPPAVQVPEAYSYVNNVPGTYFAVVTAYNSDGESDYSNEVTFLVKSKLPSKITTVLIKSIK